nr:hypothetical protein [Tanacetum cinerariifolium]
MTMSLMHQWHDTICGGVINPRRSFLERMDPRYFVPFSSDLNQTHPHRLSRWWWQWRRGEGGDDGDVVMWVVMVATGDRGGFGWRWDDDRGGVSWK